MSLEERVAALEAVVREQQSWIDRMKGPLMAQSQGLKPEAFTPPITVPTLRKNVWGMEITGLTLDELDMIGVALGYGRLEDRRDPFGVYSFCLAVTISTTPQQDAEAEKLLEAARAMREKKSYAVSIKDFPALRKKDK